MVGSEEYGDVEHLRPFIVRRLDDGQIVGLLEAARQLEVPEAKVIEWAQTGILLAWETATGELRIPAEQILGPGEVVPGVGEICGMIGDPELAWVFLSQEWPFEQEVARPIDRLKEGKLDEVRQAAPSFGCSVT